MNTDYAVTFDANLVRVFLAIWDTRSLTEAADRLGLTQPAVSHALKRLRERFGDALFVRTRSGMEPTAQATRIHGPFRTALAAIAGVVQNGKPFDPISAQRSFRIAMSDVSETFFLPRLLSWLATVAPGINVESVPLDAERAGEQLRRGDVDLAIGHAPQLESECASTTLFEDRLVCLLREDHPMADEVIGVEDFVAMRHIDASTHAPGHRIVDLQLSLLGLQRDIAVRIRHLMTAPSLVRETNLAVIYPQSMAAELVIAGGFAAVELPFATPAIDVKVHVHRNQSGQSDITWLTQGIRTLFAPT